MVGAAHDVDFVEVADGTARGAAQLRNSRYAAMVRHGALTAEGKGLDVGELDSILRLASGERQGRKAKAKSEQTGYHDGGVSNVSWDAVSRCVLR